jgi:nucleoside-diphosphate-sugar epimerase
MNDKLTVLVTGGNGFIGRHLAPYLAAQGHKVVAASRTATAFENPDIVSIQIPDLSIAFDWRPYLQGCDTVIHLAGIAHISVADEVYDQVNHHATERLAEAADQLGSNLIFVSSIAAQSGSFSEHELSEDDAPQPVNAYGKSKLAAEQAIRASGASFTILRPVVMYGEGEKGNFAFIHKLSRMPIPLPFGGLTAKRSVLSIQNFCCAVQKVLLDPRARGETFIVSDPEPVTVPELVARHRASLHRSPGLLTIPATWIELSLNSIGRGGIWQRVGRPLIARPKKLLAIGWKPV